VKALVHVSLPDSSLVVDLYFLHRIGMKTVSMLPEARVG
jgi:hypothetical protein